MTPEFNRKRREWYRKNSKRILQQISVRRAKNRELFKARDEVHYKKFQASVRLKNIAYRLRIKTEVLSHYGKDGTLRCRWSGCECVDIDMLTLDHVGDNGAEHRASGFAGGVGGYVVLKNSGYPEGYQTLCANHQLKKETERKRREAWEN